MAERYEMDDYSFEEYSDESINLGCVCSWSISDTAQHRPVVDISIPGFTFNSESHQISDKTLYSVMDRLQQGATGTPLARVARASRRIVRAVRRDYDQDSRWKMMPPLAQPRRFGETIELVRQPNQSFRQIVRRLPNP
jgi:hypothetical protein